jgi:hypothetical protein
MAEFQQSFFSTMTKTVEDYFREFEDKVVSIQSIPSNGLVEVNGRIRTSDSTRLSIFKNFERVRRFIKGQNLENQRDLWNATVDLLNGSKAFNDEGEIREELLEIVSREFENLNKDTIFLQLHTQKATTVKGNAQNAQKESKPDNKFNWQGTQAQLVFLIEQLYEQGFLSSITQPEKFSLLSQHFTVNGKSLNPKTLAQTRQNSLNTKKGKPKAVEKIEQIVSAAKKQNP